MKKGILAGLGGYLVLFITTIQTIIVTRQLGPLDIGNYAYFRQFSLIGAQLITLGIPSGLIYYLNQKRFSLLQLLSTNLKIHVLLSLLYLIVLVIFKDQFEHLFNSSFKPVFILSFGYALFVGIRNYIYNTLLARLQISRTVLLDIIPVLISFSGVVILIMLHQITVYKVLLFDLFIVPFLGMMLGGVFISKKLKRLFSKPVSLNLFGSQVKRGFWFNLSDMMLLLQAYLVYYLVNFYISQPAEIGYYSRAFSIINLFVTSLVFMTRYFYASWAKQDISQKLKAFVSILILGVIASAGLGISIYIFANAIVTYLFGVEFLKSAIYLKILTACIPMNVIFLLTSSFNNSEGNVRYNFFILLTSVLSFLVLYKLVFFNFNSTGIAYSFTISTFLLGIISLATIHLKYKVRLTLYIDQLGFLMSYLRRRSN